MNANKALILARKHIGNGAVMDSSARACLADAIEQYDAGNYDAARMWATKSLAYSVGVFHADYRKAFFMETPSGNSNYYADGYADGIAGKSRRTPAPLYLAQEYNAGYLDGIAEAQNHEPIAQGSN